MWDSKKSLRLSEWCTLVGLVALLVVMVSGPRLVLWLVGISYNAHAEYTPWFLATLYSGCVVGVAILVLLYGMLRRLRQGLVFVPKNVAALRYISWFCFLGGGIAAVSALYYLPWGIVGLAALFGGLVVRVMKNIIAEAVHLKEENDYTI